MPMYHTTEDPARAEPARTPIRKGRALSRMTQESLAEYLRIEPRTLRRYETGELPTPDGVMLEVAELAGQPLLWAEHYKRKYGIPDEIIPPLERVTLSQAVVNLLYELERIERTRLASSLLEMARNGVIDPHEEKDFAEIMRKLDGVRRAVEQLRYCGRKEDA